MVRRGALVILCLAVGRPLLAQTTTTQSAAPSTADKLWQTITEWYSGESNRTVQSVRFSGRFQYDLVALDGDAGTHRESNLRRIRLGSRVSMFRRLLVHAEFDVNPQEHDPFYVRLTDAYVQWTARPGLALTVGKQGVPFTQEGATSSKELLTIDRSNLANNLWFPQEYVPGISASGRLAPWSYFAGVFSAGAANREFGYFTGEFFTVTSVGYDFGDALRVKNAIVGASHVYQRPDVDNTFTRRLEHTVSLNLKLDADRWGVRGDVAGGRGYLGQSNLWGAMVMPFVSVTRKSQLVGRYTWLDSARPNGLSLAAYESRIAAGRGDRFSEIYLGANYFFYGHKLKFQSGVAFADMDDRAADGGAYSGVSWTSGVRVGW